MKTKIIETRQIFGKVIITYQATYHTHRAMRRNIFPNEFDNYIVSCTMYAKYFTTLMTFEITICEMVKFCYAYIK